MQRPWAGRAALAFAILGVGCVSDHDALVRRDGPGGGGRAGDPDSGGKRDGSIADAGAGEGSEAQPGDGEIGAPDSAREPRGPDHLTLLHGVVDAPRVAFCFIRQREGQPPEPIEPLFPPTGLDYATPLVADTVAGIDFSTDAVRVVVAAGEASVLGAASCAQALSLSELAVGDASVAPDAAASDAAVVAALRARTLPLLPAPTLAAGRSMLLVATGCLGAPAHDSPTRETICGTGYTTVKPTLGMVLAPMSRLTSSTRLGMQALHASRATDSASVVSVPPAESGDPALFVASDVVYGELAPRFANIDHAKVAYGTPLEASHLDVRRKAAGGNLSVSWGEALARGGLASVDEGKNYAAVIVGPLIGSSADWANPPTLTVVRSDR